MKANELRIGNYVKFPTGTFYKVDIIYNDYKMLDVWEPIPLTEEWLKKLGFVIIETRLSFCTDKKIFNGILVDWANKTIGEVKEVKHVHQLQNLYFALTNTELICE